MRFKLKRPCAHCPFRTDIPGYLRTARAQEIAESLLDDDWGWFACHETTEHVETDDGFDDRVAVETSEHCAGAMIFLLKQEQQNVAMRLACALGDLDLDTLDLDAPVAASAEEFIAHHAASWKRAVEQSVE
jgi:Family of unknown function (DUF6283)